MNKDKSCVDFNKTASVENCVSTPVSPATTPAGRRIIRVPVVLAERQVNTNLVANIHFPEPVLEIKDIKKRVKIIQCRLLTPSIAANATDLFPALTLQLFLKGFVRKNIQYATPCPSSSRNCVSSKIRSLTTDIPFECVTTIPANEFITPPQLPFRNSREEFDFFRAQELGRGFPEKDELLSSDLSQFHQESQQFYNQMPFCEILSSQILEWDESVDRMPLNGKAPFEEGTFRNAVEKMFLQFTIKIMQNQQVRVDVF